MWTVVEMVELRCNGVVVLVGPCDEDERGGEKR
jgi:hypothetical protein